MQQNSVEGQLSSEFETEHDHASDPEEEDVVASLEDGGWIEALEVVCGLIGPREDREWE